MTAYRQVTSLKVDRRLEKICERVASRVKGRFFRRVERDLQCVLAGCNNDGHTSIQLRSSAVRISGYRFRWPWYWLFHLGWAGALLVFPDQARKETKP